MALEQSINADSKSQGGIVSISQRPTALHRWFLTFHEREAITTSLKIMYGRRVREGGVHWVHLHPPPTWERSSAHKCPKEEGKFRPDMSAKKNVRVPLRYDKIKTKKVGKKEEKSTRKGIKFKR